MKKLIILALPMFFIGTALQGEWQLVTDFEDANEEGNPTVNSKIVGTKIWSVDADIPGFVGAEADPAPWVGDEDNIALHVDHQNTATGGMETAYILMPERIENGTIATLYFRWWMNKNGGHETAVCLTDWLPEDLQNPEFSFNVGETPNDTIINGYGNHKTWWRLAGEFSIANFGYSSSNNEANRDSEPVVAILGPPDSGKSFVAAIPENQQYQPGVWLEMWIVYDTEQDIKIEYQRQNDGIQKRNHWAVVDADGNVEQVIDYMFNQEGPTDLDYDGIYMVNWSRPNPNYDTQVYMDDIWIDYDGENLTTPPHGKTRSSVEIDTTPYTFRAPVGSPSITLNNDLPAEAQAGNLVQLENGTIVGEIASISGRDLNLVEPLSVEVPGNQRLSYVETGTTENWQLVTNFEDANEEGNPTVNSNVVGTKVHEPDAEIQAFAGAEADPMPWVGDEGNMALHLDHMNYATGGQETAYMLLPGFVDNPEDGGIKDGTTATLYFRWWMSRNGLHGTAVMLTDTLSEPPFNTGEAPNDTIMAGYGDHKTWWRIGHEAGHPAVDFGYSIFNMESRDPPRWPVDLLGEGSEGKQLLAGVLPENQQYQPGVWMEMWIVYDTDNDIKMEYQRQNDGLLKQNRWAIVDADGNIEEVIDYQPNFEGSTDKDYNGIYMANWCRPNQGNDTQVYMDDVWIDYSGVNLTTPPHMKTRSMVMLDTMPRTVRAAPPAQSIFLSMDPPPEAQAGKFVQLEDGTVVGQIASISGRELILMEPLSVVVPGDQVLSFVDFVVETGGNVINISTRGLVGDGDEAMIAGFIAVDANQTVIVYAKGFGDLPSELSNTLVDPVLTIQNAATGEVIMVNDNWEDDPDQAQLIADLWGGAVPLNPGSTSSAAVLTVSAFPETWTARVNAKEGTNSGGIALVEVWEVQE